MNKHWGYQDEIKVSFSKKRGMQQSRRGRKGRNRRKVVWENLSQLGAVAAHRGGLLDHGEDNEEGMPDRLLHLNKCTQLCDCCGCPPRTAVQLASAQFCILFETMTLHLSCLISHEHGFIFTVRKLNRKTWVRACYKQIVSTSV